MKGRFRAARAFGLLGLLGLSACHEDEDAPQQPVVRPALTMVVEPRRTPQDIEVLTGTVEPRYEVQQGFRVAGRMVSRDVNVGDAVKKGQTLASLDPTVARLALASATANLASAQATATNSQASFSRQQDLLKGGSVSRAQFDLASEARSTAQAAVRQAQAAVQKMAEQVDYATLSSSADAIVASWSAEVGQVVNIGQPVVKLVRPDERDAVFDVPARLVDRFSRNTPIAVSLQADPAITARGVLREVAPRSDAATQTLRIRLTLKDAGPAFRLGTMVKAQLVQDRQPGIDVPASAILRRDGATFVWLVASGGTLAARKVALGAAQGDEVPAIEGLSPGDRILTAGVHSAVEGQRVEVTQP